MYLGVKSRQKTQSVRRFGLFGQRSRSQGLFGQRSRSVWSALKVGNSDITGSRLLSELRITTQREIICGLVPLSPSSIIWYRLRREESRKSCDALLPVQDPGNCPPPAQEPKRGNERLHTFHYRDVGVFSL